MNHAGWASYDRDSFRCDRRSPDDVRAAYANRPSTVEPDWRQIHLKVDDIFYDVSTNHVLAWRAFRTGQLLDSTPQKLFERRFPTSAIARGNESGLRSGFSPSPRVDTHSSPREGHSPTKNDSGTAPDRDAIASRLSSADESGRRSPTSVFRVALVNCETIAAADPDLDRFMEESGHVGPALLGPPKDIAGDNITCLTRQEKVLSSVLVSVAGEGVTSEESRAVAFVITSDTSPTEALLCPIIETSYFLGACTALDQEPAFHFNVAKLPRNALLRLVVPTLVIDQTLPFISSIQANATATGVACETIHAPLHVLPALATFPRFCAVTAGFGESVVASASDGDYWLEEPNLSPYLDELSYGATSCHTGCTTISWLKVYFGCATSPEDYLLSLVDPRSRQVFTLLSSDSFHGRSLFSLSCATVARIHRALILGFGEGVVAQIVELRALQSLAMSFMCIALTLTNAHVLEDMCVYK